MNGGGVLPAQLRALRAQLVAQIELIDLILAAPAPAKPAAVRCPHPASQIRNIGTMGHFAQACGVCGEVLVPDSAIPESAPPLEAVST